MENKKKEQLSMVDSFALYTQKAFNEQGIEATTQEIKNLLKTMEIKGLLNNLIKTPDLVVYFIKMCKTLQLNPFLNEIYAIPFNNTLQIVVDYKQYIKRAKTCDGYCGYETILVDRDVNGKALPLNEIYYIVKCKRKDDEFITTSTFFMREWNKGKGEWATKPIYMLEKTAIKNTLCHVFPEALNDYVNVESNTDIILDTEEQVKIENQEKLEDIKNVIGK